MLILILATTAMVVVTLLLSFTRFARSDEWRATVTPLASIIGSGFLISGPLLAHDFGRAAILAMAVLLALAYAVGWVIRVNIAHVEPYLETASPTGQVAWMARTTQVVLSLAYTVSVAYYLKLLAEFSLKRLPVPADLHVLASNGLVTIVILALIGLGFTGGLRRVEEVAQGTVSLKIGIISGLLVGLGC